MIVRYNHHLTGICAMFNKPISSYNTVTRPHSENNKTKERSA